MIFNMGSKAGAKANLVYIARSRNKENSKKNLKLNPLSSVSPVEDIITPSPPYGGGIKRCFYLTSDVCLSVAYIGPNSRTGLGTDVAHVTRETPLSRSKGQRSTCC